jgi:hypothetical protein
MRELVLRIGGNGTLRCLYTDEFPLAKLGTIKIKRATVIRWNEPTQKWEVWSQHKRRRLYQHRRRTACLAWENNHQKELLE